MFCAAVVARFTDLVGEPPMQYLTRWRMHVAIESPREEKATIGELALRLGYGSDAAFSRAFKGYVGVAPGAVRRGEPVAIQAEALADAFVSTWRWRYQSVIRCSGRKPMRS